MVKICLVVFTLCLAAVNCFAQSSFDYRRPIKVKVDCCQEVSKAKLKDPITDFKEQLADGKCVEAVIFRTQTNGSFCCDPKAKWVRRTLQNLRKKGAPPSKGKKVRRKNAKKGKSNKPKPTMVPSQTMKTLPRLQ